MYTPTNPEFSEKPSPFRFFLVNIKKSNGKLCDKLSQITYNYYGFHMKYIQGLHVYKIK